MKWKDCLDPNICFMKPLYGPDEEWISAYRSKLIPESVYKFYIIADYFSFNKCPKFLQDKQKILFPHLEAAIDLIKLSFEEYPELIDLMKRYDKDFYDPIKEIKGEPFDKSAPKKFNRYFQLLIINMYSILDCIAEVIAVILSWGNIGRAQFSNLVDEIKKESREGKSETGSIIIQVEDRYIEDIKNIIKREILEGKNRGWYELFKLYRNKQSHFRRYSGFKLHDDEGKFYHFLTRRWPYYLQQDMKYTNADSMKGDLKELFSELLIEQDIFEYCQCLHKKIYDLTEDIFRVLVDAFKIKKETNYDISQDVEKKVQKLIQIYTFKSFEIENDEYS